MRLFVFLLSIAFTTGINAEEKIISFHSQIRIEADGSLFVVETIEAQVEGQQIKRGIVRDFPTDYQDRFGRKVTVPFEVQFVRRNGRGEPSSLMRQRNGVSVRIGNSGVMLPPGVHVYEIGYRTRYQLGFFEDHDELYWNVNGNGWTFAMDQVSAEVLLAAAGPFAKERAPASKIKLEAYTGAFGAKGRDYTAEAADGGARFETTRRLSPGEGLTIVFMFPKGIVAEPPLREKFRRWLNDNVGEAVGAAGLLVFLSFLYWRWSAVGRDPRSGPEFPRYEAPAGLGPAGARYLDRMQCDDRCFAAALLDLGQRGYLKISKIDGGFLGSDHYRIEPTGKQAAALPGEQPIAALLKNGAIDIGRTHDPAVEMARDGVRAALETHFGEKLFSRNRGSQFVALLLGLGTLAAMFFFEAAIAAIAVAGIIVLVALIACAKLLPAYTEEGRRLEDEVEGLRQYLTVAEKDDLARQKRPPRTPEEFAKFLPYAVALGVEKTWADAFAAVLGSAALSAAVSNYYSTSSTRDHSFSSVGGFTDSIADMGRTISAASTPPGSSSGGSSSDSGGSSGGGGGGSSGGGGGGGGGSGW